MIVKFEEKNNYIFIYQFVASIFIVLIHIDFFLNIKLAALYNFSAVHFFFILSGFFYGLKNYKDEAINDHLKYLQRKIFKIYPLHLIMLLIYLFLELAKFLLPKFTGIYPNYEPFLKNNIESFFSNIFLLNSFVGGPLTFNSPSWFLSALIYSSIIFVLLKIIFKKLTYFLIIIFILLYSKSYTESYYYTYGLNTFLNCIFGMAVGYIGSYYFLHKNYFISNKIDNLIIFFLVLFMFFNENYLILISFLFSAILVLSIKFKNNKKIFKSFIIKYLIDSGKKSYSIYMIHSLVFWIFSQFLRFLFNTNFVYQNGLYKIDLDIALSLISVAIIFIMTLFISRFSYQYVEIKLKYSLIRRFK